MDMAEVYKGGHGNGHRWVVLVHTVTNIFSAGVEVQWNSSTEAILENKEKRLVLFIQIYTDCSDTEIKWRTENTLIVRSSQRRNKTQLTK